ncbi:MAG: S8 family peptidase [Caldisericia bacterium]|nr:S8 family peptidase [Caldisericia bacterium]
MDIYEHLPLSLYKGEIQRKKNGGGGYKPIVGRIKNDYSKNTIKNSEKIISSFSKMENKYSGILNPSLIFEIEINQGVDFKSIEKTLNAMGIHVLATAENKNGFWVVFSDDVKLESFNKKLTEYGKPLGKFVPEDAFVNEDISKEDSMEIRNFFQQHGILDVNFFLVKEKAKIFTTFEKNITPIPEDHISKKKWILKILKKYHTGNFDFFNAFGVLSDIPKEEKIGRKLKSIPLSDEPDFIDVELWRMNDVRKNEKFINELKLAYRDTSKFKITDKLITKSFVLLRVKTIKKIFNELIELKEISRADRPLLPTFNPFDLKDIDVEEIERLSPDEDATGILIIDSGTISNHPLLEKCTGGEDNFQIGEIETHDLVGHGTAVAGCAAYGDIEECVLGKSFKPSNWIFSSKVMYAEINTITGKINAVYNPEKLVEHQLKDAIEGFLSNTAFNIRVVNISLGNSNETWGKDYKRQLPLASVIDELAYMYNNVVFIVSAGNQDPRNLDELETISDIKEAYPKYLVESPDYKIINPATSALAITVGSVSQAERKQLERFGEDCIKTSISTENQPSPFTRTGPGINGMIKPELVEYGGNLILYNNHGLISEDPGGKLLLLNNQASTKLLKFDYGTSFSAPKISHIAGQIANRYPQHSANFTKCMLLSSARYPFVSDNTFYKSDKGKFFDVHFNVSGFGVPSLERAIKSYNNRVILFDEGNLQLNKVKVYSLNIPDVFFNEKGRKKITVCLTFTPDTRSTRGDSYLGNRMEVHLFHSLNPQDLVNKYGVFISNSEEQKTPDAFKRFKLKLTPRIGIRSVSCHQKAWREFKREPRNRPNSPISLVLINYNKWMNDESIQTDYCISVIFEHENEIDLYNQIRANIRTRARVR